MTPAGDPPPPPVTDTLALGLSEESADVLKTKHRIDADAHLIDPAIEWAISWARHLGAADYLRGLELAREHLRKHYTTEANRHRREPEVEITPAMEEAAAAMVADGKTYEEAAKKLGVPPATLWERLNPRP